MSFTNEVTEVAPILKKGFNPKRILKTHADVVRAKKIIAAHYRRENREVTVEIRTIDNNRISYPGVDQDAHVSTLTFAPGC